MTVPFAPRAARGRLGAAGLLAVGCLAFLLLAGTWWPVLMAKAPPVPQNSPASSSTPTRESPPPPAAARQAVPPLSALDLNAAEVAALERLPGLGPVLARRIVADREAHGAFRVPEDLLRVPGVGEKRLARIRPLVRTEERP